ncbi:SDR family oxidoreductase [Paraburkholderia sp. J12]|uniref:SDR family oxidoreductase n=1 Tax=Paraburkholderia sp. J12 TaxID=2805432 RepID=UPI002ABE837D|nr:SDR family oxidoreductase [Paraburkholderia sp. J12]
MDLNLAGQVAIVTGSSQGIGLGIAERFAREGAKIVMTGRRADALETAAEPLRSLTEVLTVPSDVRKAEDTKRVVEATVRRFGTVHVLVNNDGAPPLGPIEQFDDDTWDAAVERNLMSVVRMVREVVPYMREQRNGAIVNIAALSAIQPMDGFGLSVATWAGLLGYAKSLANEIGVHGIRINTICPGYIDTPRLQKSMARTGQSVDERAAQTALKRIGQPDDIGAITAFLASPLAGYVTGTAIQVDGGMFRGVR